jgi:hypothetical protein
VPERLGTFVHTRSRLPRKWRPIEQQLCGLYCN